MKYTIKRPQTLGYAEQRDARHSTACCNTTRCTASFHVQWLIWHQPLMMEGETASETLCFNYILLFTPADFKAD
jgi:hypothetical protein